MARHAGIFEIMSILQVEERGWDKALELRFLIARRGHISPNKSVSWHSNVHAQKTCFMSITYFKIKHFKASRFKDSYLSQYRKFGFS